MSATYIDLCAVRRRRKSVGVSVGVVGAPDTQKASLVLPFLLELIEQRKHGAENVGQRSGLPEIKQGS